MPSEMIPFDPSPPEDPTHRPVAPMDDVPPASADEYPVDDTTRSIEDVDGILRSPRQPEELVNDLRGAVTAPDAPVGFWRGPGTFRDRLRIFAKHERSLWSLDAHDAPKFFPGQTITRGLARVTAVLTGRDPTALADRWADRVGKFMVLRGIGLKAHLTPLREALSLDRRSVIFEGHLEEIRARLRRTEEHLTAVYNSEMAQLHEGISHAEESVIRAEIDLKNVMRNTALSAEDREDQIQNALANLEERKKGFEAAEEGIKIHEDAAKERLADAFRQIREDTAEEYQSLAIEIDSRERDRLIDPPWFTFAARRGAAERAELKRLNAEIKALEKSSLNTPEAQASLNAKKVFFFKTAKQGKIGADMQTQLRFDRLRSLHRALGDEYFDRVDARIMPENSMQPEGTLSAKYDRKDSSFTYSCLRERLPDAIKNDPDSPALRAMHDDGDVVNEHIQAFRTLGDPRDVNEETYLEEAVSLSDDADVPEPIRIVRRSLFKDALTKFTSNPNILKAAVGNAGEIEAGSDESQEGRRAIMYRDAVQRMAYNLSILPEYMARCWPERRSNVRPAYDRPIPPMLIAAATYVLLSSGEMEKEILKRDRYKRSLERSRVKFANPVNLRPTTIAKFKGKKIDAVMIAFNSCIEQASMDIPAGSAPPGKWLIQPNIAIQNAIYLLEFGRAAAHQATKYQDKNRALDLLEVAGDDLKSLVDRLRAGVEAGGTTRGVFDLTEEEITSFESQIEEIKKGIAYIPRLAATP